MYRLTAAEPTQFAAGPEPKVLVADVQRILRKLIPAEKEHKDDGESVSLIADKADTSTRTVYRVLGRKLDDPDDADPAISLDLADRLVMAADSHLAHCRLKWPDGRITPYIQPSVE